MTPDDAELLTRLGGVVRSADPVPETVRALARASFGLSRLDAELAELVSDSDGAVSGPGSASSGVRLLTFETGNLAIEAVVSTMGAHRSILGKVLEVGPPSGNVCLEDAFGLQADEPEETAGWCCDDVALDEFGGFRFDGLSSGTVRLVVTLADGRIVATRWFTA
ncbi:MAG: hypothetical protein JWM93_1683 [Frankiales bacterium]|nr:hypothetical protein [Frankiales bacterium]